MAQHAANFTFTPQNKPSILEVIAQKSLNDTLYPAWKKLITFLYTSNPEKHHFLFEKNEEVFLIINGLLNFYYFKHFDSSFSENFYGLKRTFLNGESLNSKSIYLSVFCTAVFPYIKNKVDEQLLKFNLEKAEGRLKGDNFFYLKKLFLVIYPTLDTFWTAWTIVNYLRYMSGNSGSQTPILQLLNLKLLYTNEVPNDGFWLPLFRGQLGLSEFYRGFIKNAFLSVLELAAFFMQFLQSLNAVSPNFNMKALPKVSPPPLCNQANNFKGKCPICHQNWKLPTVVPISGYIFCFACIYRHLKEHQMCPVTNLPTRPLDCVRLYHDSAC